MSTFEKAIVVTGGLGVVGSNIVMRLLDEDHKVAVLDACEKPRNTWTRIQLESYAQSISRSEKLHFSVCRMEREKNLLRQVAQEASLVIHAAASTGIPHSAEDPLDDWRSNVDATHALLEAYRVAGRAPTTVAFSSVKPYALDQLRIRAKDEEFVLMSQDDLGVNESFRLEPDEPYAASKMAQSALCLAYARSYDMPITVLRFSNLYGPGACHGPRHGWLTWFCISAAIGRPIEVQGDGRQTRDMLYVSDIHKAVMAAAEHIERCKGEVFNVGGGVHNTISVSNAAETLRRLSNIEIKRATGRKHEDLLFVTDYSKFKRMTMWRPYADVHTGIKHVYEWAVRNREALSNLYRNA